MSSHFLQYLFAKDLGWRLPSKALARRIVEAITDHLHIVVCALPDVAFAGQPPSKASVSVLDGTFFAMRCPAGYRVAMSREGLEGSQNHVWVSISAWRCGQLTNSVPRSKVMGRRATRGRSLIDFMIFPLSADCCTIACRAEHNRLGALVWVFQDHSEAADALDQ